LTNAIRSELAHVALPERYVIPQMKKHLLTWSSNR
jgi:hypothetical protein